jgi:hypothetical protein
MSIFVHAVDQPGLAPFEMPDRFRTEIAYFMSLPGEPGVPELKSGEYWIDPEKAKTWLDDGEFHLISPLDSGSQAEVELSEAQEAWLEWMVAGKIDRIRLV